MSKRRSIISYDKLNIEQKKQLLRDFPDGYINHLTTIKTPTGEILDALIWETEEVIYLVKINKIAPKPAVVEEDDFSDDFEKVDGIKDDDLAAEEEEEEDEYDRPDEDGDEEDED